MGKKDRDATSVSFEELKRLQLNLEEVKKKTEDLNSLFPETKKFLEERGMTHIRELNKQGLKELREHLEKRLKEIRGTVH